MKRISNTLRCVSAAFLLLCACGKDKHHALMPPPPDPSHGCRLVEDGSGGGPGYQGDWKFEYSDSNVISRAYLPGAAGTGIGQATVQGNTVTLTRRADFIEILSYYGDLSKGKPAELDISLTEKPTTWPHWDHFIFTYDQQGRLTKFTNSAGSVAIYYDAKGNVTRMENYLFTAPRVEVNILTTVTDYDDKPSPYAGIPMYKFLQHNMDFSYYDEQQFIAALSANNPGKITTTYYDPATASFINPFIKKMSYTYYDNGMPHTCDVSDISSGTGKAYASHSYGYDGCK